MKALWAVIVAAVILAGCAQQRYVWRADTTYSQMEKDYAECEYEGLKYAPVASVHGGLPDAFYAEKKKADITRRCLSLKGYTEVTNADRKWKVE